MAQVPKALKTPHRKSSFFGHNNYILACDYNNSLELSTNNSKYRWLVDTGATLSAVKFETVQHLNLPIHKERINIKGIGGRLNTEGYVYIPFTLCDIEINHKFYVLKNLPCTHDGIIGQDFLIKYNCIINYENNQLTLKHAGIEQSLPLDMGKLGFNNYVVIPPRCEKIFEINFELKDDYVILPKELCEGVFIAGSICKPKNGKILIQLLNTRETEVGLSYFQPDFNRLSEYHICCFDKQESDGERVRKLLSLLKLNHLNEEENISIQNICAKYSDVFYLPGDKLGTCNLY